jgi:paraquat-inducible protein A
MLGTFVLLLMTKYSFLDNYKRGMSRYYRFIESLGKYSMLDVYVVVLSASFIQFDQLIRVEVGDAIIPFTLVVIFTMLASRSFDIRLIWEKK